MTDSRLPLIEFKALEKYFGSNKVLSDIDLAIDEGEVIVLVGPSGSGKSTLIRCINGLERPSAGSLRVDGVSVEDPKADMRTLRKRIGMVFQHFNLYPHKTVLENVTMAPISVLRRDREQTRRQALDLLHRFGIGEKADVYPVSLSGGQQQRVGIARALAMQPSILLFDEPTSALDPETVRGVLDIMRDLARGGMTMIVVTHEMGFAREVADRVVFMEQGRIVEVAPAATFFARPATARAREFLAQMS